MNALEQTSMPNHLLRNLRDRVYGHPTSDRNWETARVYWRQPAECAWLLAQSRAGLRGSSFFTPNSSL